MISWWCTSVVTIVLQRSIHFPQFFININIPFSMDLCVFLFFSLLLLQSSTLQYQHRYLVDFCVFFLFHHCCYKVQLLTNIASSVLHQFFFEFFYLICHINGSHVICRLLEISFLIYINECLWPLETPSLDENKLYECKVLWNIIVNGIEILLFKGFDIVYGLNDPTPTSTPSKKSCFRISWMGWNYPP